jgi:hypothetical protein
MQNDVLPELIPIQDIATWPLLNLAQIPWVMENVVTPATALELYWHPHQWVSGINFIQDV